MNGRIKKKREYEDVPEEDAYEEILQSWERKRKEKKIKREREGKDPSRIPKFIKEKHSWSDLTAKQKKAVKRIVAGEPLYLRHFAFLKVTMDVRKQWRNVTVRLM